MGWPWHRAGAAALGPWALLRLAEPPARLKKRQEFASQALGHESVGLEEAEDGVWRVSFYDRLLARVEVRDLRLRA